MVFSFKSNINTARLFCFCFLVLVFGGLFSPLLRDTCNETKEKRACESFVAKPAKSHGTSDIATAMAGFQGTTGVRFSGDKIRSYDPDVKIKGLFSERKEDPFKRLFVDNKRNVPTCSLWAVTTTIFEPNESIIGTANLKDWCIVIVGDLKTPDEAFKELEKKDNVVYLSADFQKKLMEDEGTTLMKHMPWKSFGRKNIGFGVACSFGAKVIYDFDDDNILLPLKDGKTIPPPFAYTEQNKFNDVVKFKYINDDYLEKVVQEKAFNPFPFMGAEHHHSWPRGFPLEDLWDNFETWDFIKEKLDEIIIPGEMKYSSIGVIQSLANKDPDNDAVFRLSRYHSTQFEFDSSDKAPSLLIPSSTYTPFNAQATVHLYHAFWGLYLPFSVTGRVTDIWRGFITQRIFKDLGLSLLYTPPIVVHERSAHDYLADLSAESDVYQRTSKLHSFLDEWSPQEAETLPEMIFELWVRLYEHDYIDIPDVEGMKEWLNHLNAIGYQYPPIQKYQYPDMQKAIKKGSK